jgi:sec-independent protein translocase protein TatA
MPFGIQPIHILVIVVVALLIFGPKRLPQLGRWIGRTFFELRKSAREMTDGFKDETAKAAGEQAAGQAAGAGASASAPGQTSTSAAPASPTPAAQTGVGIFCIQCGAPNPQDARFCNKCGVRLPV